MPRLAVCPSCQSSGSIPDGVAAKRIRCPKCKTIFEVAASSVPAPGSAASASSSRRLSTTSAAPRSKGSRPDPDDSLDVLEDSSDQLPTAGSRSPAAALGAVTLDPRVIYTLIATSGAAVVLLAVVCVMLLRGGSGTATPPSAPTPPALATITPTVSSSPESKPSDQPSITKPSSEPSPAVEPPASATALAAVAFGSPKTANQPSISDKPGELAIATPLPSNKPADPLPVASSIGDTPNNPQRIIRRLKDASVYIISKFGSRPISTGSGFVIEVNGNSAVIATNRHVAFLDVSTLPASLVKAGGEPKLDVVFYSGLGAGREQTVSARIMAADLTPEYGTDLAFLEVTGIKNPPMKVDIFSQVEPEEGIRYVGAGFPLGEGLNKLSDTKGNPSVTITGGRIAALRRDNFGQVSLLQVDGSLQPGNSGGPILEENSGRFIGVAVASLSRVGIDTIGFIVPGSQVLRALSGRVGAIDLTLEPSQKVGTASLLVSAQLIDPKNRIQGVAVRAIQATGATMPSPSGDGTWPPLQGAKPIELELRREKNSATAKGRLELAVPGQGSDSRRLLIQTAHRNSSGQVVYSPPKEVRLPNRPGRIVPPNATQEVISRFRRPSLALLGPLIDPSKDCRLDKDEDNFKLKIEVPGKLHTLSPEIVTRANKPLHNAPMSLADVNGDFIAIVEIIGEIAPGSEPPKDRAVRGIPFTYQSAGLVLYQDRNNFLRLERAASVIGPTLTPVHRLVVEAVKDGKQAMRPIYLDVPEGDTILGIERIKGRVRCVYQPSSGKGLISLPPVALDLSVKVKVGISASNVSIKPFTASFANFVLINDVTKIDVGLGN
jgi:hypothetical protein